MPQKLLPPPCSQDELKEIFNYNPKTGEFFKILKSGLLKKAGFIKPNNYIHIRINVVKYYGHKLAWYYMTGEWVEVDHKDLNRLNNKFNNLRKATRSENNANKTYKNSTGYKGVSIANKGTGPKPYHASITLNKKRKYLGAFKTAKEAHAVYCKAAKECYGEFANFNCA